MSTIPRRAVAAITLGPDPGSPAAARPPPSARDRICRRCTGCLATSRAECQLHQNFATAIHIAVEIGKPAREIGPGAGGDAGLTGIGADVDALLGGQVSPDQGKLPTLVAIKDPRGSVEEGHPAL